MAEATVIRRMVRGTFSKSRLEHLYVGSISPATFEEQGIAYLWKVAGRGLSVRQPSKQLD